MKRVLFIDRDGTILAEPADEQVDSLEKMEFIPGAISGLRSIAGLGYELVMATNQDGLGTPAFPEEDFWPAHNKMLGILKGEGVVFDDFLIDEHFPADNSPFRKPGIGMFGKYVGNPEYDLAGSWVIGDRDTDAQLAANLGTGFLRVEGPDSWAQIAEALRSTVRRAQVSRKTKETDIQVVIDLDGKGPYGIDTGLKFFDHMLDQIAHHSGASLLVKCKGDLEVDEHHTMEDVAIALGEAIATALGDKRGIGRYGFALPMDESRALVLLDFGGRIDFAWDVQFTREYVGDTPTEMFKHFFQSLCSASKCNLRIEAKGENNHHIAEAVFKAYARALKMAIKRDVFSYELPSSKGLL
ncbi:MAG: bifunctional histidinol-phosphatase/imidazoleglycerol-phosphate dehydratase HisB [Bacteroidales bacterium]|nr:bifunctional histidinol-phosphatase/imidazoleglycerol-phosphate dehydratase HisB [Bacteroidales bacterium]MBQ2104385.1 bifunctional histidinol-phosphatase/imidazoleglycerol-phosphate dehydratase HisB [Bacteroidales bacterium]MBQ5416370.1 bifunctional histidinol-phosphatase/imidazoleglycerol-phosphate dehydratase HisB [Bacteroidales bacterium]